MRRHPGLIFGLKIVEFVFRHYFDNGERLAAKHAYGYLGPAYEIFDHNALIEFQRALDRRHKILPATHHRDTDGGTLARGFNHAREFTMFRGAVENPPFRGRQAYGFKDHLRVYFVHGQRA